MLCGMNFQMDDGDWEPEWTPKYQFNNLMVRPCAVSLFSTLQQVLSVFWLALMNVWIYGMFYQKVLQAIRLR